MNKSGILAMLLVGSLPLIVNAQAVPCSPCWPVTIATTTKLLQAKNTYSIPIRNPLTGTATTVNVSTTAGLNPGMVLTAMDASREQMFVQTVNSSTVFTVIRGYANSTQTSHTAFTVLQNNITDVYHNVLAAEVASIESSVNTSGGMVRVDPTTGLIPPSLYLQGGSGSGLAAPGTSNVLLKYTSGLATVPATVTDITGQFTGSGAILAANGTKVDVVTAPLTFNLSGGTTTTFTHNYGNTNIQWACQYADGTQMPFSPVQNISTTQSVATFLVATAGKCVVVAGVGPQGATGATGPAGSGITSVSGDAIIPTTTGAAVITLNNVNTLPGTYGTATKVPQFSVNQKGLVTSVTEVPITALGFYQTFLHDGTASPQRAKVNFVSGTNVTIVGADNGTDTTTYTFSSTGGGPGGGNYQTLLVNTSAVTPRAKLSLVAGSNITLTPTDNGTDTSTVTIASTGGGPASGYSFGTLGAIPATCTTGNLYTATDQPQGQQQYTCTATNTWTQNVSVGLSGGLAITSGSLDIVTGVVPRLGVSNAFTGFNTFGTIGIAALSTPSSSSAACTVGMFTFDATNFYGCTATNTWKKLVWVTF